MSKFSSYKSEIRAFLKKYTRAKKLGLNLAGGKKWRGSLVISTYQALTGKRFSKQVLKVAAAAEFVQAGLLVHDDIMDQDEQRRGQPTAHRRYREWAEKQGFDQPAQLGISLAICEGDAYLVNAFELISELDDKEIRTFFTRQLLQTIEGQELDVKSAHQDISQIKKEDILEFYRKKTGYYTFSIPLTLGGKLAGLKTRQLEELEELGTELGVVFQIKDDELGLFGDEKQTGKAVGADVREGKKTLYYYYLYQQASSAERQQIDKWFGNRNLTEKELGEVHKLMAKYEVKKLVKRDLIAQLELVQKRIIGLKLENGFKEMLRELIEKTASRSS